ncbi:MAG: NAD(+) synthase [Chloroflexi bacterium RBG_16_60_22]|nr:MAG: NAD(+) synthase [Chloroflexi bacterium RBG_16_60_22]
MDAESQANRLVAWIKEKVAEAGLRGVVLGLSGGLDSSVLGVLCFRAFPQDTLGVIMPCHSLPEDGAHARALADRFNIPTAEVPLDNIYDTLLDTLPDYQPEAGIARLARANLKARLRMVTLYYIANQRQYLVAGSGNRAETTIGYFTKYGDGGVDILPLGNLVKEQVRELARHLDIPREIIAKPPSAGLWEGQTDEAEMGLSYDSLDRYILTGDAPEELKNRIETLKDASRHKRAQPPTAE